jgi:hypothetical protein
MSDQTQRRAGVDALTSAFVTAGLAVLPGVLVRLQVATAPSGGHIGDGLAHALPYLAGSCLAWVAVPFAAVVTLVLAHRAYRLGARGAGRGSLLVLLALVLLHLKDQLEFAASNPDVAVEPAPKLRKECVAAALAGDVLPECQPPSSQGSSAPQQ